GDIWSGRGWQSAGASLTPTHRAGFCAFYGECGRNPEVNVSLLPSAVPCLSNSPAREGAGHAAGPAALRVPELLPGDGDNATARVCCSYSQLLALQASVGLSGTVLARCPACARNFANLYCHNICSPDQSLFTEVTRVTNYTATPGQEPLQAVLEYRLFYRRRFAEAAFQSCRGVRLPATGGFAIATMCGRYGAELCTAQRWLDFQGRQEQRAGAAADRLPAAARGRAARRRGARWIAPVVACDKRPALARQPCSCQDCALACPVLVTPSGPPPGCSVARASDSGPDLLSPERSRSAARGTTVPRPRGPCLLVAAAVAGGLSAGLVRLQLTTDPVELWSAPASRARQEKAFHDRHFGPFLRTNQVIVTAPGRPGSTYESVLLGTKNFSGVLAEDVLRALLELQDTLAATTAWAPRSGRNVTLSDVCYAPLNPAEPGLGDCAVTSVTQYFQNNGTRLAATAPQEDGDRRGTADWRDHLIYCVNSPLSFKDITALELSCMAEFGGPVFPYIALGGYAGEYTEAQALIVTYSLNNFPRGDPRLEWAQSWERRFLDVVRDFQRRHRHNLSVAFSAERSLEDEINRTSGEDIPVFAVSYLLVFAYIALALGEYTACRRLLVSPGVSLSPCVAVPVARAAFVPSIARKVVPFLVLAVGADNIFIFVQEFQVRGAAVGPGLSRTSPVSPVPRCPLSRARRVAGALSSMPAVRTFALTAALAIAFDFLLQMSGFVALVALDKTRISVVRIYPSRKHKIGVGGLALTAPVPSHCPPLPEPPLPQVLLFLFLACSGLFLMFHVSVGLDQELALPEDSYLLQYFSDLNQYLAVGVPTYFVTTGGYNFSSANGTNAICSSAGCDTNSLTQTVQMATRFPNVSYLAIPANSWVDDFLDWLSPMTRCCRIHQEGDNKGQFCPATSGQCGLRGCRSCLKLPRRPTAEEFQRFLPWFLQDRPTLQLPSRTGTRTWDIGDTEGHWGPRASPTRFMAYQRPLRTSQEYTAALRAARALAERVTSKLRTVPGTDPDFEVFPYAVTYVYYEQYLTVVAEGLVTLSLCLVPTFAVSFLLLGMDVRSSLATLLTIAMVLLDTVGLMALWGVPYNAVALINLVAAVGISVEFVSHITCAFARSRQPTRVARAAEATVTMGSKVVAGVAMTNLPGVVVLAFAKARLIQIFFFRLNLIVTLVGLAHGLAFLPVLLSYPVPVPVVPTLSPTAQGTRTVCHCPRCPHRARPTSASGGGHDGGHSAGGGGGPGQPPLQGQ
uniref:NPC1 like intracellular cholesterol transporter 1 n=1 Tax=Malurus cyaneus samueli TaxID=2593467 RepID=A0A8C5X4I0_9PASS